MKIKTFASEIYGEVPEPSSFEELIELTLDPAPDKYCLRECGGGRPILIGLCTAPPIVVCCEQHTSPEGKYRTKKTS
jgi:hypothetical protein